ncbi:maltose O-acetyltransferase [Streptosporangium becharense]|uniref:Maltose O-acetyltransferase n=1 Tax=Streptosporangium becharense TaxID=1816182 RepID=A0A7W9IMN0_9ACTN|nr:sugar O-acetyltransferase [Streptosporangium becharense]MBB2914419.1 maltose O-acetyltransferase [Streptosporangium becharense]MBB5823549.1 maltose O-acetyltransferase [Streptosporangium becharense]
MTDLFPGDPRTNWERMIAGDLYIADDPELQAALGRAAVLAHRYGELYPADPAAARLVLEDLLGSIAPDAHIRPPLYVDYGSHITVGPGSFANFGLTALDVAPITIGADVQIGPHVQLLTPTHPLDPGRRRAKLESAAPIVIGDNVWLGGGAIVLAGVTIGANSVIGAGAVVTGDVPEGVVAVGTPAKVVRHL